MAWSSIERRDELWNFGLTTAIGGQIGLLLGLAVQLDRIWQNGDEAVDQLGRVDAQLHRMEHVGSLAIAPPATAAQAFRSLAAGLDRAGRRPTRSRAFDASCDGPR